MQSKEAYGVFNSNAGHGLMGWFVKSIIKRSHVLKFVGGLSSVLVLSLFQNCAGDFQPVDLSSAQKPQSSQSSADSSSSSSSSSSAPASASAPAPAPAAVPAPAPVPAAPAPAPSSPSQMYNFVAGSKEACDLSVANVLRTRIQNGVLIVSMPSCRIGGGCGISCGVPNGTTCVSANPNYYGACLSSAALDSSVELNLQIFNTKPGFNFVSPDVVSCNEGVKARYSIAKGKTLSSYNGCTFGGGCGVSCGKPNGTTCVSANPTAAGSCFSYSEFGSLTN